MDIKYLEKPLAKVFLLSVCNAILFLNSDGMQAHYSVTAEIDRLSIMYSTNSDEETTNECFVCYQIYEADLLPCSNIHPVVICKDCLANYLYYSRNCPYCQQLFIINPVFQGTLVEWVHLISCYIIRSIWYD